MIRQRAPFERKWSRKVKQALRLSIKDVLSLYSYDNLSKQDISLLVKRKPMEDAYKALYKDVGLYFARQEQSRFKRRGLLMDTKDEWSDVWSRSLEAYAEIEAGSRITGVTGYTQQIVWDKLTDIIKEVRSEGLSITQTTDRIQRELTKTMGKIERWRSMRIAQTEVMTASNKGSYEAANSLGIPMTQFWRTGGANIRDSHSQAESDNSDGVPLDGTFLVAGQQVTMPGDPGLPPGEVINCKCWVLREAI